MAVFPADPMDASLAFPHIAPSSANAFELAPTRTPEEVPFASGLSNEERERKAFMGDLHRFMIEVGKPLSKIPIMGYKELDLFQLFKEVSAYGGFNEVVKNVGTWSRIWKRLGNFDPSITDSSFRLKKNYERYLLDYEFKCFPDHRNQSVDVEKQIQIKRSSSSNSIAPPSSPSSSTESPQGSPVVSRHTSSNNAFRSKSAKPRKSASSPANIPRESDGSPKLPLILGDITIECLGTIVARTHFVTDKHAWPVGFTSSRLFTSSINPDQRVRYVSQIIDAGERPQFVVTAEDDPTNPIIGHSPSSAWRAVLKRVVSRGGSVNSADDSRKSVSVSGNSRFGLTNATTAMLVREMVTRARDNGTLPAFAPDSPTWSPSRNRKRASSSDSSSDDEEFFPTKSSRYEFTTRNSFWSREEEIVESAVATLHSLKFCTVY
jgi:hypothetical protein